MTIVSVSVLGSEDLDRTRPFVEGDDRSLENDALECRLPVRQGARELGKVVPHEGHRIRFGGGARDKDAGSRDGSGGKLTGPGDLFPPPGARLRRRSGRAGR